MTTSPSITTAVHGVSRQKLLEAAMQVFAESGFRGATTRRIAEAAGVNEVTLFRHFKSKAVLINEAAKLYARQRSEEALPSEPVDPLAELSTWCTAHLALLRNTRGLIRKCMAEVDEHPQMAGCMRMGPDVVHGQLTAYATRLTTQRGWRVTPEEIVVACMMLQGSLFSDAMGRDVMPDMFPRPVRQAGAMYARGFLRMLGDEAGTNGGSGRPGTNGGHPSTRTRRNGKGRQQARPARGT
jgi:AcrR family transcriptional regulator